MDKKILFGFFGFFAIFLPNIASAALHGDSDLNLSVSVGVELSDGSWRPLVIIGPDPYRFSEDFTVSPRAEVVAPPISFFEPYAPTNYRDYTIRLGVVAEGQFLFAPSLSAYYEANLGELLSGPQCSLSACISVDPLGIDLRIPVWGWEYNLDGNKQTGLLKLDIDFLRDENNPLPNIYDGVKITLTNIPDVPLPPAIYGFISGLLFLFSRIKKIPTPIQGEQSAGEKPAIAG